MIDPIDIVFRTVTVMAALLLAALLLANRRGRPAAVPGAMLCLAIAAFFVTSTASSAAVLGTWRYLLTALCVTKAVWFWLLTRGLFIDGVKVEHRHLAIVGIVALTGTWQQTIFLPLYRGGEATALQTLAGFGFEGVLLSFVVLSLYIAWRDLAVDLVERRRRLRIGLLLLSGAYLAVTLFVQSRNLLLDVKTPLEAARANMLFVTAGCLIGAWFLLQPRNRSWLDTDRSNPVCALNPVETTILAKLEQAIETDRVHLHEGLSIGSLAAHLGTGEHVLRRVINKGMGYRNFNDFLHARRIAEACEELARPEQARLPVLSIAMKVGYGSIGAFNRAFKSRIGMTPTAYRRDRMNGASHAG